MKNAMKGSFKKKQIWSAQKSPNIEMEASERVSGAKRTL